MRKLERFYVSRQGLRASKSVGFCCVCGRSVEMRCRIDNSDCFEQHAMDPRHLKITICGLYNEMKMFVCSQPHRKLLSDFIDFYFCCNWFRETMRHDTSASRRKGKTPVRRIPGATPGTPRRSGPSSE